MSRPAQVLCAVLGVSLLMGGALLATVLFARVEDIGQFTRDATAIAGVPWWIGAISRLTNLCWAAAAAGNLMAAWEAAPSLRRPLLLLGLLCTVIAVDDTMLLHEVVIPQFGVPDKLLMGGYAVAGLILGWWWLRAAGGIWVRGAFFIGAAMLAVSLTADVVFHGLMGLEDSSMLLAVEDGAKLFGVVAWCFCGAWAVRDDSLSERPTGFLHPSRTTDP